MGLFKSKFPVKKKVCKHPRSRIRNIYGDEIRYASYNRSTCMDCGTFFKCLNGKD